MNHSTITRDDIAAELQIINSAEVDSEWGWAVTCQNVAIQALYFPASDGRSMTLHIRVEPQGRPNLTPVYDDDTDEDDEKNEYEESMKEENPDEIPADLRDLYESKQARRRRQYDPRQVLAGWKFRVKAGSFEALLETNERGSATLTGVDLSQKTVTLAYETHRNEHETGKPRGSTKAKQPDREKGLQRPWEALGSVGSNKEKQPNRRTRRQVLALAGVAALGAGVIVSFVNFDARSGALAIGTPVSVGDVPKVAGASGEPSMFAGVLYASLITHEGPSLPGRSFYFFVAEQNGTVTPFRVERDVNGRTIVRFRATSPNEVVSLVCVSTRADCPNLEGIDWLTNTTDGRESVLSQLATRRSADIDVTAMKMNIEHAASRVCSDVEGASVLLVRCTPMP